MTRPSFRVFITHHHGGLVSAVLLRRHRVLFDKPPPAAMAATVDDALARLAPQAALLVDDDLAERYLWKEELELRRVEVEIHPGRPDPRGYVIAKATVPIRLGYAANRALLLDAFPGLGLGRTHPADGAFYLYADVSDLTNDASAFCRRMLDEAGVAATPGLDFDAVDGHHHVRFSFAGSQEDCAEAVRRLKTWLG